MWTKARMLALGLSLLGVTAFAQAPADAPRAAPSASGCVITPHQFFKEGVLDVQQAGAIRFLTGGIGADEARAMRERRSKYPLTLTFAQKAGQANQFLSRVLVEISRDDGAQLLCATSEGPYLFVDLPAGKYRVVAASKGQVLERKVDLAADSHADLTLLWPADAGTR